MSSGKADQLFVNGKFLTQDPTRSVASQMATEGNRILEVGDELSHLKGPKTVLHDLQGAVVVPGFIDAHLHFLWGGETLLAIPGNQARSKESFMELISTFAKKREPGSWLRGGGWNENIFLDHSYPHKSWLDEAAPGHPMILQRHDGHSGIASSAALALAGIGSETPDPEGGVIDRDAQGEPTGVLRDAAMGLVMDLMPSETEAELQQCLEVTQKYLLAHGVTAVGDMIHDLDHFRFLQKMARNGDLKVRISAYLPILQWDEIKTMLAEGIFENEWLQFKGLKGFSDGSLGSHTALMLEPYEDTPGSAGIYDLDWSDVAKIQAIITEADKLGYQAVVHAIGDRAVREVLDVFESVIRMNGPRDRRFRVEHAQHIHPADLNRFKELDVIPSVQPAHCVDDSLYAQRLLGDRCSYAYPFASLVKSNADLALGSDWPVSPAAPLATLHDAIHRAGWYMEERLDLNQALYAHTAESAYAGFRDTELGSLKAGCLADFVILDPRFLDLEDVTTLPENLIRQVYSNGKNISDNLK